MQLVYLLQIFHTPSTNTSFIRLDYFTASKRKRRVCKVGSNSQSLRTGFISYVYEVLKALSRTRLPRRRSRKIFENLISGGRKIYKEFFTVHRVFIDMITTQLIQVWKKSPLSVIDPKKKKKKKRKSTKKKKKKKEKKK